MIKAKEIEVRGRKYTISKLPATVGREVLFKYSTSNLPKVGDYKDSDYIMQKLMSYVAVNVEGREIQLTTEDLINNHIPDAETLILLEKEMMKYNYDFFTDGKASSFLQMLAERTEAKTTEMLTLFLDKLLAVGKRH